MQNKTIKYLGIDWGERRIGLAVGDSELKLAIPFGVVGSLDEVLDVIREEEIDEIIIGNPLKMRSNLENVSGDFLHFLRDLRAEVKLPIKTSDERLSSKAADALPGNKKTKASRDAVAAMLILQGYLDK